MSSLNSNNLIDIFHYLQYKDIFSCLRVCKHWLSTIWSSNPVWKIIYLNLLYEKTCQLLQQPIEYNTYYLQQHYDPNIIFSNFYHDLERQIDELLLKPLPHSPPLHSLSFPNKQEIYRQLVHQTCFFLRSFPSILEMKELEFTYHSALKARSGQAMHIVQDTETASDYLMQLGGYIDGFATNGKMDILNLSKRSLIVSDIYLENAVLPKGWYYCSLQIGNIIYLFGGKVSSDIEVHPPQQPANNEAFDMEQQQQQPHDQNIVFQDIQVELNEQILEHNSVGSQITVQSGSSGISNPDDSDTDDEHPENVEVEVDIFADEQAEDDDTENGSEDVIEDEEDDEDGSDFAFDPFAIIENANAGAEINQNNPDLAPKLIYKITYHTSQNIECQRIACTGCVNDVLQILIHLTAASVVLDPIPIQTIPYSIHRAIFFGGKNELTGRYMNQVYLLTIDESIPNAIHWQKIISTGEIPCPRCFHSAQIIDREMYVFSGWTKESDIQGRYEFPTSSYLKIRDEYFFNDIYILNIDTFCWRRLQTYGIPPSPRSQVSMFTIPDPSSIAMGRLTPEKIIHYSMKNAFDRSRYLVIFGGATLHHELAAQPLANYGKKVIDLADFYILDLYTNVWLPVNYEFLPLRGGCLGMCFYEGSKTVDQGKDSLDLPPGWIFSGGLHSGPNDNIPIFRNGIYHLPIDY